MTWFTKLTLNQRLALAAFILGAVALGAKPMRGSAVTLDAKDLALAAQRGADSIGVGEVADALIAGHADYRLIDLRDAAAFSEYHLPGAENVPLATLPDADLQRNDRLVLYAEDGVRAAQGWFLLKAKGFKGVYMVRGGLEAWKKEILFPTVGGDTTLSGQAADAKRIEMSKHFGGAPMAPSSPGAVVAVAAAAPTPAAMPKLEAPAAPAAKKPAGPPKKKEGC